MTSYRAAHSSSSARRLTTASASHFPAPPTSSLRSPILAGLPATADALSPMFAKARFAARIYRADRLNLFLDRDQSQDGIDDQQTAAGDNAHVAFDSKPATPRQRLIQRFRIVLPHVGLVLLSACYTIMGAAIFHHFEMPYELHIRNETMHRVHALKQSIIDELWTLSHSSSISSDDFSDYAQHRMDLVIKDVFIDYTKNYMTPDDIINGTGPVKWSWGSSIFFSWTSITTIGYGHIVPRTMHGRIAVLVYALIGIPLILVTIADMGRFLSGGILWVHGMTRQLRIAIGVKFRRFCCCCRNLRNRAANIDVQRELIQQQNRRSAVANRRRKNAAEPAIAAEQPSDAGTFEDISEIQTHISTNTPSEDTRARADELVDEDYELPQNERRVSVLFVLVIMIGYTAGGAMLMQLWEDWDFFDAFYFCFVTVTTIGFGDIVPQSESFLWATLSYIVFGLIITTMCIDLVGSEYIRDIHFYGRTLGRSFMTIGGKVVHLGEVFGYIAYLQRQYGLTAEQLTKLAQLPEDYLLDCLIHGRQPDLKWLGGRPFVPPDIYYFKWIEHPRTLSFASERVLASMESLDMNTSRCSTARTLTPREYYQKILMMYCKQMQPSVDTNQPHAPPPAFMNIDITNL